MDGSTSSLSDEDRGLLTRLALGEASSDPQERAGVIATALNRVGKPGWADSVKGVVFQPKQFAATQNKKGGFYKYSADDYANARNIVDGVVSGSITDPTGGATNFHASSMDPPPKWTKGKTAQQIGQTKFYGGTPPPESDFLSQFEKPAAAEKGVLESDFLSQFENPTQSARTEPTEAPSARVAGEFQELDPRKAFNYAGGTEPGLNEVGPSSETIANVAGILGGGSVAAGVAKALPSLITRGIPAAAKTAAHAAFWGSIAGAAGHALGPTAGGKLMDIIHSIRGGE